MSLSPYLTSIILCASYLIILRNTIVSQLFHEPDSGDDGALSGETDHQPHLEIPHTISHFKHEKQSAAKTQSGCLSGKDRALIL